VYRDLNRQKIRERQNEQRQSNLEKCREQGRKSYAKHRDKRHQKFREWYWKNRDARLQKKRDAARLYRKQHVDKCKDLSRRAYEKNPWRFKAAAARRKTRQKGLPYKWCVADANRAITYWKNSCAVCSTPFGLLAIAHWDHWIPLASPHCPGTVPENMVPLCSACNQSKHAHDATAWLARDFPDSAAAIARRIGNYFSVTAASSSSSAA
jgi:hypothetical protein